VSSTERLNHDSPASIRSFLESRELAPRKRWGQNFLINRGAREKIVALLGAENGMRVWEIGPGLGAMSELLLDAGADLTAFEIDPAYGIWLRESLESRGLTLVEGDVLKSWEAEWEKHRPDRVLGNLPYNAASAVIAAFIESDRLADRCVFTVQDEMGQRIIAAPGSRDYSSFSILCQTGARITDGGRLSPGSFYPAPRVRSRIVALEPARPHGSILDGPVFRRIVRTLFASRRKTLGNNLIAAASIRDFPNVDAVRSAFEAEGIDLRRRPETVSPSEWVAVANRVVRS